MVVHHLISLWTVYYALSRPFGHMYMMWVLASEVCGGRTELPFFGYRQCSLVLYMIIELE